MKQQYFEKEHQDKWQTFEGMLSDIEQTSKKAVSQIDTSEFSEYYRHLCHHLSLARERQYSPNLVNRLNSLVLRGHQQLYQRKSSLKIALIEFIVVGFPTVVRQEWRFSLAATLIFLIPAVLLWSFVLLFPELIYSVFDPAELSHLEEMYDPGADRIGRNRESDTDFAMFGYYIQNNIGVGFRTFATGIVFCLGSIFFLTFNGIIFGAISAHIINLDYVETFYSFVIGHSSFELTAIVLSGAAGLKLGYALISPGDKTRLQALRESSATAIKIIYGVILMLVIAAFIEAFWSSSTLVTSTLKYGVGGALWFFVLMYFFWMGRSRGS
jgi:uncharacterized membrane protein SpoIIM required for sporulation